MTFEPFLAQFHVTEPGQPGHAPDHPLAKTAQGISEFFDGFGGATFNNGLYRVHHAGDLAKWTRLAGQAWPELDGRILCFAYDWLGRHFALDAHRIEGGEPLILLLAPEGGQYFEIPATFSRLHNETLFEMTDTALAVDFFEQWRNRSRHTLRADECAGYRRPLFLGGKDGLENLEVTDLEVYWTLTGQLIKQVRGLPPGTPVKDLKVNQ